ncbi:UNVERIFIED_ORG: hypothetical protein GGR78_003507 [Xanthomonas campestris]
MGALSRQRRHALLATCTPTISGGPCPLTVAGPYAALMPRKSLHGRTCGVSREGGWARTLQQTQPRGRGEDTAPVAGSFVESHAHRPSRLVLARSPSRDLTRHECRVSAYRDVLAACPAMVGGQGPCSKLTAARTRRGHRTGCMLFVENHANRPSRRVLARPPSRDLTRHGCRVRAYMDVLAACPARVGGQGPCSQTADRMPCFCFLFCCFCLAHTTRSQLENSRHMNTGVGRPGKAWLVKHPMPTRRSASPCDKRARLPDCMKPDAPLRILA